MKKLSFLIFTFLFLNGCISNKCDNVNDWILEAPEAFNDFLLVKHELLSNKHFVRKFSFKNSFFLSQKDTASINFYQMPRLGLWFRKSRGYISFSESDTSCCFEECNSGRNSAHGYIYFERYKRQYKSNVQLVDSLSLGNGWSAHVVTCIGCGD